MDPPAFPMVTLDVRQRMEHRVGPAQLLLSELLPLPVPELTARLEAELDTNAALELPAPVSCPTCGHPLWRGGCVRCVRGAGSDRPDRLGSLRAPVSSREQLLNDAAPALTTAGRRVAAHLVADVDDYGVLDEPVALVARRLRVRVEAVHRVIAALRATGSPGLCAENLVEALRLQAAAVDAPAPPEVARLLAAGLDDLTAGVPPAGLDPSGLCRALAWLRAHLTPELVERAEPAPAPTVDLLVRGTGDRWRAVVVPGPWSAVRVAESYRSLAADPAVRGPVTRADRFVTALERRERALQRVGDVVVARQAARMVRGPRAHRTLTRRDVAVELGMHESTVSRAVAGKHVALPSGEIVTLAALFGAGRDARDCLREVVRAEVAPLSDTALVVALAGHGHRVARRTVAKYRAELGIPDLRRRAHLARDMQLST